MAVKRTLGILVTLAVAAAGATAGDVPETVSPGASDGVVRIAATCPTFSWAAVTGTQKYELVVYALGGTEEEGRLVATVRIPGAASSWTPSLEGCMKPGGRYVWFLRAVGTEVVSEWSGGRSFEVVESSSLRESVPDLLARVIESAGEEADSGETVEAVGTASDDSREESTGGQAKVAAGPAAASGGVEIAEASITIGGLEVVTTATDRDTLGGMSCANGQLAKWNAGLAAWQCGNDAGGTAYMAGNQLSLTGSTFHVVEGAGSDLDADTVDGVQASGFLTVGTDNWVDTTGDTMTGTLETVDVDLGGAVVKDGTTLLWADGDDNTALGKRALSTSTIGRRSTAIGAGALENDAGTAYYYSMNTAVGAKALYSNTTGHFNTAVGADALRDSTVGYWNTAVGKDALLHNTTGFSNNSVGAFSMASNTEGSRNTAMGGAALGANTTGDLNTAVGYGALFGNAAGLRNSAVGARALRTNQGDNPGTPTVAEGSDNSAFGFEALDSNTTGFENTAVGAGALEANTTGIYNTAVGAGALGTVSGSSNTAVGTGALAGALGSSNIGLGKDAGSGLGTGSSNILIGHAGDTADVHTMRLGDSDIWDTYIAGIRGSTLTGGDPLPVAIDNQGKLGTSAFGGGSGLNADLLDGHDSSAFLRSNTSNPFTSGTLTFAAGTVLDIDGTLNLTGASWVDLPSSGITGAGAGSGLDADKLDGLQASSFVQVGTDVWVDTVGDTMTGTLILSPASGNALVATAGRVGIGTATPDEHLEIQNSTGDAFLTIDRGNNSLAGIRHKETGTQQWIFPFTRGWQSDNLIVRDEFIGADVMTFQASTKRVGIGTPGSSQPLNVLDVRGVGSDVGGDAGAPQVLARFTQTDTTRHSAISIDSADLGVSADPGQDPVLYLANGGEAVWDIRMDDSDYAEAYYDGVCYSGFQDSFEIRHRLGGENFVVLQLREYSWPDHASCPSGSWYEVRANGDVVPVANDTFDLGASNRKWQDIWATNDVIQTSDSRLKEDVMPIGYGLDEILGLRPVSFAWRGSDDSRTHLGLIAQEVEPLVPEAVRRGETADAPWAMTYSSLTPVLIQAIQDQQAIIEELRQRIEVLEDGL